MRGSEFAELRAFAAIVERSSFARAAEHLGFSASALSQTIRQLETRLGVALLNRTTRSVAPTKQGERLYERIAPIIRDMDAAVGEAMSAAGRVAGTLRINAPGMAVKKLIAPRFGRFHRMHPDVVLDVAVDDGLSDIVAGHFDAGIRVGERLEKDMIAVRLTPDVPILIVASPEYLERHGEPKIPVDLHRHAGINWRFPGSDTIHRWRFRKKGKASEIAVEGPLITNSQELALAAALQGLGILYAYDDDQVDDAIAAGRLKRVLADWSPHLLGLFLYYPDRRNQSPALRAFIDCLLDKDLRPGPAFKARREASAAARRAPR
ncbi:MAG: LysR family transcriptional regulator [Rhizomicrobium sp.]